MHFPNTRLRRLRQTVPLRNLARETRLSVEDLVLPLFIHYGTNIKKPISSMPDQYQLSIDQLEEELIEIKSLGIRKIILFGIPEKKDAEGSDALSETGVIQSALKTIKAFDQELLVMTDLCFCEYMDHGHCGILDANHSVDNDQTLSLLGKQAVAHVKAGADIVAPSGMIDGAVQAIRHALNEAGFIHTPILSYAVKYASALYGPFREAAEGVPQIGDRQGYQMDWANASEALRECALDVLEGADLLMVKPAHTYLDIIYKVKQAYPALPLGAYHTSGEFVMIKAAAEKGWINERATVMEVLTGIKRAGADFIFTYYSKEVAKWLST